jgi:hydrogenase-4 component F
MLAAGALLSLGVAAALLLRQRDYKRMLAYSSIEHMGVLALGAAAGGPLGLSAVLLHMLGHGLAKASLFVLAGRLLSAEGTTVISNVRSLLVRRPGLAVPWLVGMAALLGFPPSSVFFSEVGIVVAGWTRGMAVVTSLALALLLVASAGLFRLTTSMLLGGKPAPAEPVDHSRHGPILPIALALGLIGVIGFLSTPVGTLLHRAAAVLGGGS